MEPTSFRHFAFPRIAANSWAIRVMVLIVLLALCLLPAQGQVLHKLARNGNKASRRQGQISRETVDAGDFYETGRGQRHLLRSAGMLAIKLHDPSRSNEVINALLSGPLAGYQRHSVAGHGIVLLKASDAVRKSDDLRPFENAMKAARLVAGVRAANPVLIGPQSRLALLPNEEVLIRLKPGVRAETYFGAAWPKGRRLNGTVDQFAIMLENTTAEELLAETSRRAKDESVLWAEPNFLSEVIRQTNDPLFPNQFHLSNVGLNGGMANADVKAPLAWNYTVGNSNVVIALLDDGCELAHPDLSANIFSNPGETLNGSDDDNNGYVDDLHGWDFFGNDNDPN